MGKQDLFETVIIVIYLIVFFSFLLRALPRLLRRNALVSDTYFHLYCAAVIRENSFRVPRKLPRVILKHEYTYPFLYSYLLALFPLRYRLWMERLTGAIFDTLNVVLVYLFSSWIVQTGGDYEKYQNLPLLVAALFAFSPALLRIGSGPRAYSGNPRVMGETFYLVHILTAYYALSTNSLIFLLLSLLAGAVLIVTSKFGNQVLLFFGVFFSIFVSYKYILVLGGILIVAILLGKKRTLGVIKGQVKHSAFYFKYLQAVFLYPHVRASMHYLRSVLAELRNCIRLRWWSVLHWYYNEPYFLHLFLTVYPQFVVPLIFEKPGRAAEPVDNFLFVWMISGLIWFLLTKLKKMMFLGEGERYLEYALLPSILLTVKYLLAIKPFLVSIWIVYSLLSALFYLAQYFKETKDLFEATEILFLKLKDHPKGVILPIGSFHWQTIYRSTFPVLTIGANVDEHLLSRDEFMLVYGNYPYPSNQFSRILERYNVSYVLTDHSHLDHYTENILQDPQKFYSLVELMCETQSMILFKVKR